MGEQREGQTKQCSRCFQVKPIQEFSKRRRSLDGLQRACKPCDAARGAEQREANPERFREYQRNYDADNRDARRAACRRWRAENPEYGKSWERRNPANSSARSRRWQLKNMSKVLAANAAYRAAMAAQTIPLSDEQKAQIVSLYAEARRLSQETGIPHEVDHICPLRGENSCGLHVPWNLRVIPAAENLAKGNRLLEAA